MKMPTPMKVRDAKGADSAMKDILYSPSSPKSPGTTSRDIIAVRARVTVEVELISASHATTAYEFLVVTGMLLVTAAAVAAGVPIPSKVCNHDRRRAIENCLLRCRRSGRKL